MKLVVSKEHLLSKVEDYKLKGIPFHLSVTDNAMELVNEFGVSMIGTSKSLSLSELSFMQRVGDHIRDKVHQGQLDHLYVPQDRLPMFKIGATTPHRKDVVEIDINGAYWRAAYLLGVISLDLYQMAYTDKQVRLTEEGARTFGVKYNKAKYYNIISRNSQGVTIKLVSENVFVPNNLVHYKYRPSKDIRLIVLGMLAKRSEQFYFDGSTMHNQGIKLPDPKEERVWRAICHHVHNLMHVIMNSLDQNQFVLYWVDALIVTKDVQERVVNLIEQAQYSCKIKPILGVSIYKRVIRVKDTLDPSEDRIFNF